MTTIFGRSAASAWEAIVMNEPSVRMNRERICLKRKGGRNSEKESRFGGLVMRFLVNQRPLSSFDNASKHLTRANYKILSSIRFGRRSTDSIGPLGHQAARDFLFRHVPEAHPHSIVMQRTLKLGRRRMIRTQHKSVYPQRATAARCVLWPVAVD